MGLRIRIKSIMILVAIIAFALSIPGWMLRRQNRFGQLTKFHIDSADILIQKHNLPFRQINYLNNKEMDELLEKLGPQAPIAAKLVKYHWSMAKKYNYLTIHPYGFAADDPPKPPQPNTP